MGPDHARARGLLAHGVDTGDRVGIWAPNRYEWVVLQFAAARVGAILVNINPAYKTAELEYALKQSGVSLLLLARGFRTVRLRGHARRGARAGARDLSEAAGPRGRLGSAPRQRRVRRPGRACPARSRARVRRRGQHPVHLGHDGLAQRRHAVPPQHPQQRLLRGRAARR